MNALVLATLRHITPVTFSGCTVELGRVVLRYRTGMHYDGTHTALLGFYNHYSIFSCTLLHSLSLCISPCSISFLLLCIIFPLYLLYSGFIFRDAPIQYNTQC